MKRKCLISLLLVASGAAFAQSNSYDSVDPFIGSAAEGNTFPGATLPFGMIQWSPDTRSDGWYHYGDPTIRGFSLTRISGAGCPLYSDVPILPWSQVIPERPGEASQAFSHHHEIAHPGYYSVEFENGIKTELTVKERAGMARFHFPPGANRALIFKAGYSATADAKNREEDTSTIDIRGDDTVVGTVHSGGFCGSPTHYVLYFAAKFQTPFTSFGSWSETLVPDRRSASGHKAGGYVSFSATQPIVVKVGVSFVSIDNAEANLAAEVPGWDFDALEASAKAAWEAVLGRIQVAGGTPDERTIFYTGLYHSMLSPNLFSDENGDYIGFDGKVRRLSGGERQFANFSDWDIYRNTIQLQALLFPAQTSQMMQSLVRDAEESGWLPKWPFANDVSYVMGGDSPAILLSEARAFGAQDFDLKTGLKFALKGATDPGKGPHNNFERPGLEAYLTQGYVPVSDDQDVAASISLEYNNADFAVSRFAAAMGDETDAERLLRSAENWRTLFDRDGGWIRPRTADGNFLDNHWDPDRLTPHRKNSDTSNQMGFEEGSTSQYTFMIPYNYAGLFRAIGGDEKVIPRLDKFFEKLSGWGLPNFTVTNEPDFCAPYAYLWTNMPWKTAAVIDRIRQETFTSKPEGLPGNDDLGATSGVYVWSAIGIYPEIPGVGGFAVGTPMFRQVTMSLGKGKTLKISATGDGIYVHGLRINGTPHRSSWIDLSELALSDNQIEFELAGEPDHGWATKPSELPPSFDTEKP